MDDLEKQVGQYISIHALRKESDAGFLFEDTDHKGHFNPRSP